MSILSWLALILLTAMGYSAGAVLASRTGVRQHGGHPSPDLLDTTMVVALWAGGIVFRLSGAGPWLTVVLGLIVATGVAFILNLARPLQDEGKPLTH